MKTSKFTTYLIAIIFVFLLAACSGMRQMVKNADQIEYVVTPKILEVHNDSVRVQIDGTVPKRYLKKKASLTFQPVLFYGNESYTLNEYMLQGEGNTLEDEGIPVVEYKSGGQFTLIETIPYNPRMRRSSLNMTLNIRIRSKYEDLNQCGVPPMDTIASGIIATSQTVIASDDLYLGGELDPKTTRHPAVIRFEINSSVVRDSEKRGESMKSLRNFTETPNMLVNGIRIHSYASPDGEVSLNEQLADQRTRNTFNYMKSEIRRLGFDAVHDTDFYRESTREDWDGFQRAVQRADFTQKNEVLRILNSDMTLSQKENELRKDNELWEYLADNIFPPLRRSDISLLAYFPIRDIDEIIAVGNNDLNELNETELLNYAYHHSNNERKLAAYENYSTKYPESWIGFNNQAYIHIQNGNYSEAKNLLNKALEISPNQGEVHNNLAVVYRWEKNYTKSMEHYQQARSAGFDVENNVGNLYINLGEYNRATQSYKADYCGHNVALAYLLSGNNAEALKRIDCIVDKTADDYYLRAVIAARNNDIEMLTTSVTRAINGDPEYRHLAKTDMEFREYWNDQRFVNATR